MAWLRNFTLGRKVLVKGNFDKKVNKMTNIAHNKSVQFALFVFVNLLFAKIGLLEVDTIAET